MSSAPFFWLASLLLALELVFRLRKGAYLVQYLDIEDFPSVLLGDFGWWSNVGSQMCSGDFWRRALVKRIENGLLRPEFESILAGWLGEFGTNTKKKSRMMTRSECWQTSQGAQGTISLLFRLLKIIVFWTAGSFTSLKRLHAYPHHEVLLHSDRSPRGYCVGCCQRIRHEWSSNARLLHLSFARYRQF